MTIDDALRLATAEAARGVVTIPPDLHGFPGVAHGGAVAAAFHRLALPRPPVALHLELQRSVPTGAPLRLASGSRGATAELSLAQGDRLLATATLHRTGVAPPRVDDLVAAWEHDRQGEEVPGSATCLACGSANPLGLDLRLIAAPRVLWREHLPRPAYHLRTGEAHPALALVALDELGWWLGALAQGECGVTTDVRLALFAPLPLAPLLILGDRTGVRPDEDPRGRYSRVSGVLLGPARDVLAAAEIRFAGSRAYTRRLLEPFLATTPLDELARWFPSARELSARRA